MKKEITAEEIEKDYKKWYRPIESGLYWMMSQDESVEDLPSEVRLQGLIGGSAIFEYAGDLRFKAGEYEEALEDYKIALVHDGTSNFSWQRGRTKELFKRVIDTYLKLNNRQELVMFTRKQLPQLVDTFLSERDAKTILEEVEGKTGEKI